ncbi:MAG: two-component sensor histidine kinase [Amycolatopsis sp.]|jgi:two-component system sensor histidine kinase DesK|nr:two-component sensor histidine kinase [Amycolatopsis sp.]
MAVSEKSVRWASGGWTWREEDFGENGPQSSLWRWYLISVAFLLPLLTPAVDEVFSGGHAMWWKTLAVVLLAAYSVCYVAFPLVLPRTRFDTRLGFCVLMLAIGWGVLAMFGFASLYGLIYATAVIAFALPPAWVVVLDGGSLGLFAVVELLLGNFGRIQGNLTTVAAVTGALFFMGRLVRAMRALRQANEEIATLAVAGERERMARDLHDILGHSLTTITVKAGLARRVLESSADKDRAILEIREVEGLSRSALSDVRATVSEYREVSLSAELVGARAALRAAEIDFDLPQAVDNVHPSLQPTFGYVLREAVTNVLRHSSAHRVKVRFGDTWLEIEDDGESSSGGVVSGNGLRGLNERLALVSGTVKAGPRPGGGFLVRAEAPVEAAARPEPVTARAEVAGGLA